MGKHKSNQPSPNDRRTFLKAGGLMTAAALGSAALPRVARGQSSSSRPLPLNSATTNAMPTRNLGITGHYRPDALIEALHRHPFDTILMAVNAADPHHYSSRSNCCRWPWRSRWALSE